MPVFSYLAFPKKGRISELCDALSTLDHCEVIQSDNKEVAILVTDTPDDATERTLQAQLKDIKSLQSLNMTFGHMDEEKSGR